MRILSLLALSAYTGARALSQTPVVEAGGVVDAATFRAPLTPGSLVSIFGRSLAAQSASATAIPLPKSLGGVSVSFNGEAAPLLYVSAGQINAQLPWETAGSASLTVVVTNGTGSSPPETVQAASSSPGLFVVEGTPVAINPDGSLAGPTGTSLPSHPATPGNTLILLASGLGAVSPAAVTGNDSLDQLRRTITTPGVLIGGVPAPVTFAGLSPQFVGVYQINVMLPSDTPPADGVPLQIRTGEVTSSAQAAISIGAGWPQWGQSAQHTSAMAAAGQSPTRILGDIVVDPFAAEMQANYSGDLDAHYQVPLVDGNDVYIEFKSGTFSTATFSTMTWGEKRFTWKNGQLAQQWSYTSDWRPPGSHNDFWEPVFHPALANDSVYVPGASGSIIRLSKITGHVIQRIAPFGTDPNTYETGPITVDNLGDLYYNAIQVMVDPVEGFYYNDAIDSWLVKVTPEGSFTMASYKTFTAGIAPGPTDQCLTNFDPKLLPWPPSPTATPPTDRCGSQRAGLNIAPAIAPDGTIYSATTAHFNHHYSYLVALNPDLSKRWAVSLRGHFHDGCGVAVSQGGWLPANGAPGGCRSGAPLGVDPATNLPGDGIILDSATSTPVVAPDGSILFGTYSRYNYGQGHLMHFDSAGNYLGAFGFGWDTTPAIYTHDGTWSAVTKNNHYSDAGSYCDDVTFCPADRTFTNPASPEEYLISQLDANLKIEWSYRNTNTESCTRNPDGTLNCISDHPNGFEWCVNSPAVDTSGMIYANSEDGSLYVIPQGASSVQTIFQALSLGAAYTPASLGGDGRIYSQNDGHLFVAGQ